MNIFQSGQQFLPPTVNKAGMDVNQMLNGINFVIIDQEERWWDLMPCCISSTKYNIYPADNNLVFVRHPKPPAELGSFTEESSFCGRQIMHNCRKYTGTLHLGSQIAGKVIAPSKCHCPVSCISCPIDRPIVYVSDVNGQLIGTVRMPGFGPYCFAIGKNSCPLIELEIVNCQGNVKFKIKAKCCQKSVACYPFRAFGCDHIDYIIYDQYSNATGGFIKNLLRECMTETFTSADTYGIIFPTNCFPQDKLLIIQAAIMIDFLQFRA